LSPSHNYEPIVVLVTASSVAEAETLAKDLVASRLVACTNIIEGIRSLFHWQGRVQEEKEVLLIMKSRGDLFARIEKRVRTLHSYEVPEVISVPIRQGSAPYLAWLREETAEGE
jgi:periplasmic divalent cation tolerance protein